MSNFIEIYPQALPDELCDRLVNTFETHDGRYEGLTGGGLDRNKKHSHDLMLDQHPELSGIKNELLKHTFEGIQHYFAKYYMALIGAVSVGIPNDSGSATTITPDNWATHGESKIANIIGYLFRSGAINVQKYEQGIGGYPHWHSEHFPVKGSHDPLHRVALYMYYLNDVEEGGETEFFYQDQSIKPKKGTMVVAPANFTHTHRGNTPISSDKYIATSWILFNSADKLYP